jgi:hypothetical protein
VSKIDLIPGYYDGHSRTGQPIFLKSREDIKAERKAGLLHGSYQENGSVFIMYRVAHVSKSDVEMWIPRQSGYAGPLVLQMV